MTAPTTCASPRSCGGGSRPFPALPTRICSRRSTAPEFFAQIDRARAAQLGLTLNDIANNLNISLSSSEQVIAELLDRPDNGIPYYIAVQTPEYRRLAERPENTPVDQVTRRHNGDPVPGLLSNVATLTRDCVPTNANQANIQPVYEVYASVQGRDLGSVVDRDRQDRRPSCKKQLRPATRSR